jgi:hypothetical protein
MVRFRIIFCFSASLLLSWPVLLLSQTPSQLFQQALLKENGEGDLTAALALYEKIVGDATAERSLRAKAQLHIAMCWEKMGLQQARSAYLVIINQYSDQSEIVRIARERLERLQLDERSAAQDSSRKQGDWVGATITFVVDMSENIRLGIFDPKKHFIEIGGHFNGFQHGDTLHPSLDVPMQYECDVYMNYKVDLYIIWKVRALPPFEFDEGGWEKASSDRHFLMPSHDMRMHIVKPEFYPRQPPSFSEPGFSAKSFYRGIHWPDGIAFRSKSELLVVNEYGGPGPGVFLAGEGRLLNDEADAFSKPNDLFESPDDILITPSGDVLVSGDQNGTIFKIPPAGGAPQPFITPATIGSKLFNPFSMAIAPTGFDGPNVDPGDLIIADYGNGQDQRGIWAANLQTGRARRIVSGRQHFKDGPLVAAFNSKAELFVFENNDSGKSRIVKVTPDGNVTPVLVDIPECGAMVIHPITDDIYFKYREGEIYRLHEKAQSAELFASGLYRFQDMVFSPDGQSLFVSCDTWEEVLEITGPFEK